MKLRVLLTLCAAGLAAGLLLGRMLQHEPSRPERTVQLFTDICVPFSHGQLSAPPEGLGLVRNDLLPRERRWTDPVSASHLRLDEHTCSISTNAPHALTKAEGDALAADIEQVVAATFPNLAFDPKATLGDDVLFRAWMTGKAASPQRWGVSVYMFPDRGERSGSLVSLTLPRSKAF
ncbi:hypothetical protein KUV26_10535 [Leisingera daeponensis]|uniref:Histidine kinase n=1 Tax=Leisingera daeponensis TaxID=405746 RepID=A0ABS7NF90_9RHOB|nr:hypothetical protein [Leisingera daeponensis]MBY6139872.1 hypothetical protein [Leisingera daeponensis]